VRLLNIDEIRKRIDDVKIIDRMRDALMAHSRGETLTPMPMHLDIHPGEVHIKSSYRSGEKNFALKMATTFNGAGNGFILLGDAKTGQPIVYLDDGGHLTDVRTAAVAAMVARELGRKDKTIGIIGTGIQARLTARLHARVMPIEQIFLTGRTPDRVAACADAIRETLPQVQVTTLGSRAEVAQATKFLITCTAARAPLLWLRDLQHGTHINAVGADAPRKQELDPEILRKADLLLVDSLDQCKKLGDLQHAPDCAKKAVEIGAYCQSRSHMHVRHTHHAELSVADFTGLGVEDLYIAEFINENANV
jgi:ornithine cyclodeaminase